MADTRFHIRMTDFNRPGETMNRFYCGKKFDKDLNQAYFWQGIVYNFKRKKVQVPNINICSACQNVAYKTDKPIK